MNLFATTIDAAHVQPSRFALHALSCRRAVELITACDESIDRCRWTASLALYGPPPPGRYANASWLGPRGNVVAAALVASSPKSRASTIRR